MASKKLLCPGDLILGLGDGTNLKMRVGTVIAVYGPERGSHMGCEPRVLVLWHEPIAHLVLECDCGIMAPVEIGL